MLKSIGTLCSRRMTSVTVVCTLALGGAALLPSQADALPLFARQTGQNCVACHAGGQFPELTSYGRMFKLTGYTIGARTIPLSLMGVFGYTNTRDTRSQDPAADFPNNRDVVFQGGSLFLGGKITDNLGLFSQITYDPYDHQDDSGAWQGHTSSDNFDLRYADRFIEPDRDLIVGLSLNNSPTVEDVWNSTPAWGYPYVESSFAVTPSPAPLLAGGLAQQAAGLGVYALWNKTLYAEIAGYRTANGFWSFLSQGTDNADQVKLDGLNPYWRLALTHDWGPHSAMLGTFGMVADVYPDNLEQTGPTNRYRDIGVDAQYQYLLDPHSVTAQFSYIREHADWASSLLETGGVSNPADTLDQLKLKATYVYNAKYGASLTFFDTWGDADANLYPGLQDDGSGNSVPIPISGFANNNPGSRGWVPEVFWTPAQYLRIGAQYWAYDRFNGETSNYDGNGRDARDNDALFVYVWGAY